MKRAGRDFNLNAVESSVVVASDCEVLRNIRVVLSHPQHPGNVGAAARAIKTMGLSRLILVNPARFPDPQATARATGAADLLERAAVCSSIDQALAGAVFSVAVSARAREIGPAMITARAGAQELIEKARGGEVALLFGNEASGLSNDEVVRCDRLVSIPTSPEFASLNLGSAVQLLCYELRVAALGDRLTGALVTPFSSPPATHDELEGFFGQLERAMIFSQFMDPAKPKRLMPKLRRLFRRTALEKDEINILRGLLTALSPESSAKTKCRQSE